MPLSCRTSNSESLSTRSFLTPSFSASSRPINNVAEYEGLLMGLEEALKLGVKKLRVESDSELLVRQLNGIYKVREPRLIELHRKAQELFRRFESYRIRHVYREQNRIADKLANRGIDEARGKI